MSSAATALSKSQQKKSPKRVRKSGGGVAGYVAFELDSEIDEATGAMAVRLAGNHQMLRKRLKDNTFSEACKRKGIDPNELKPKPRNFFKNVDMSKGEAAARFNAFEKQRTHLLGVALAEVAAASDITKKRADAMVHREELLAELLDKRLTKEKNNLRQMSEKRKKYENVLSDENARITQQRMQSQAHAEQFASRQKQIANMKRRTKDDLHAKAHAKEMRAATTKALRKNTEDKWRAMQEKRLVDQNKRVNSFIAHKRSNSTIQKKNADNERTRQLKQERAQNNDQQKRNDIEQKMNQKQAHINKLKAERDAEREQAKINRHLASELRMQNAERMRKALGYQKELKAKERAEEHARMERLQDINKAIEEQHKSLLREEQIRRDEWKLKTKLQRNITPGPGTYDLPPTMQASGGTWGKTLYKSEFDDIMRKAAMTPGPGHYGPLPSTLDPSGGCIAVKVKTQLDHMLRNAAAMPGPCAYNPKQIESQNNQSFSKFDPPGMIETAVWYNRHVPGPGQYRTTNLPKKKEALKLQKATRNIITVALMLKKLKPGEDSDELAKAMAAAEGQGD